jgi:hypothetical protein
MLNNLIEYHTCLHKYGELRKLHNTTTDKRIKYFAKKRVRQLVSELNLFDKYQSRNSSNTYTPSINMLNRELPNFITNEIKELYKVINKKSK